MSLEDFTTLVLAEVEESFSLVKFPDIQKYEFDVLV